MSIAGDPKIWVQIRRIRYISGMRKEKRDVFLVGNIGVDMEAKCDRYIKERIMGSMFPPDNVSVSHVENMKIAGFWEIWDALVR